jgi:hypothetical protein
MKDWKPLYAGKAFRDAAYRATAAPKAVMQGYRMPLIVYGFPGWPSCSRQLFGIDADFDLATE